MATSATSLPAAAAGTFRLGDLTVNRMGFGAMRITGEGIWGEPRDPEEAKRVLRRAVELGIQLIDTADSYGFGRSESQEQRKALVHRVQLVRGDPSEDPVNATLVDRAKMIDERVRLLREATDPTPPR